MADVEQHYGQKEGRVTGTAAVAKQQIMTPCPSPDEAMFVGEDRAEDHQKARLSAVNGDAEPANTPLVAPSTDTDHGTATATTVTAVDAANAAAAAAAASVNAAVGRESTATANGINTMATSPAESAHSSAAPHEDAMILTADDTSAPISSDRPGEQPRKASPDPIVKVHEDSNSTQVPVDDDGFLDPLDHPIDLSQIDFPPSTVLTQDLLLEVDGGAWFPTNPENGITPRIEAFAKLEFHYGQDFYLSGLNVVLGRQDKESISSFSKKKRKSENHFGDSILTLDEVKVPLFPPPEIDISSISRRHLRVQYDYEASSWTLTSLCDTGFRLIRDKHKTRGYPNGKKATLENSDIIQFGNLAFTWFLPDQDESKAAEVEDMKMEDVDILGEVIGQEISSDIDSDHDSDDGDDEDEGSDLDSREASHDVGTPRPARLDGTDDSSLMPPPPTVKRGRGRPPKNGISVREQKLLKRQAQEDFLANGGCVEGLDMTKYSSLPVDQLFQKEGEKMQLQMVKEAKRKQKIEEKEAKIREKQAQKDLKPVKIPKERKRKRTKSPPAREEDYTAEQLAKPQLPYTVMIYDAINNSEKKALTLPEIYRSLENSYPYFKVRAETTGWQSSVRHNLRGSGEGGGSSLFKRGPRSGKGYIWELVEGANIDKERKKRKPVTGSPHPTQASIQSAAGQMVPSGSWGQGSVSAASAGGHYMHPNQFAQQYQPVQGGIQGYQQATYQAAPTPSTPVVNRAPSSNGGSVTPRAAVHIVDGVVAAQHRPAPAATLTPPTWNPAQQQQQPQPQQQQQQQPPKPVHAATTTTQVPQQMRSAVSVQTQAPVRQIVTSTTAQPQKAVMHAAPVAPQPTTGIPMNRPVSGVTTSSTVPKPSTSMAVDSKAKDLLDNPIFLNIMKEHIRKNPTNNINSPEVRRALWAEFKKTSGSKAPLVKSAVPKAPIPKPPVTAAPAVGQVTPVDVAQMKPGAGVQPVHHAISVPSAAAAPIPVAKPMAVPQVATIQRVSTLTQQQHKQQPQQVTVAPIPTALKPVTQSSLPQRTNAILTGLKLDAKKRLEFLQVLKNAKEKKAAEAMGQAKSGAVKRVAEGVPEGSPVAKRVIVEGQQ
ncbi:Pre-rRNA-processing protein fhl1 [Orbilia javanica]|uniref:Pre-rRNA-processing protein fhl1 n=1 Tax=Orbilia javanica TaxID=47235 RepID=A0AAN8RLW9_9PEZI